MKEFTYNLLLHSENLKQIYKTLKGPRIYPSESIDDFLSNRNSLKKPILNPLISDGNRSYVSIFSKMLKFFHKRMNLENQNQ